MNAQELYELVKDWPLAAFPEGVSYGRSRFSGRMQWGRIDCHAYFADVQAALLFEASGMRWLDASGSFVAKLASGTYSVVVRTDLSVRITSSSKLHAIDAAIKEINK